MVKRAYLERGKEELCEQPLSLQEQVLQAQTVVLAAKYEYAMGGERRFKLLGRALKQIKQCPREVQGEMLERLSALQQKKA